MSTVFISFLFSSLYYLTSPLSPISSQIITSLTNIVTNVWARAHPLPTTHTHTPLSHLMFLHAYVFRADHLALEAHHDDFSLKKTVSLPAVINCFFFPPLSYVLLLWAKDRIAKKESREWCREQAQNWYKLTSYDESYLDHCRRQLPQGLNDFLVGLPHLLKVSPPPTSPLKNYISNIYCVKRH